MMGDEERRKSHSPMSFSTSGYRGLLERAMKLGYQVTTFRSWSPPNTRPVLLLRHDIDHSLRSALTIAEIEAHYDVAATYFVQVSSDFYNPLSREGRGILRRISDLGHEIGLHYESGRYLGDKGHAHLECDLKILEDIVEQSIVSAAQHVPSIGRPINLGNLVENEAYEDRFTKSPMAYLSDSSMSWRQAMPSEMFDAKISFQLLTHPVWWVATFQNMAEALKFAFEDECAALKLRYDETAALYARNLAKRIELDQRFRDRRAASRAPLPKSINTNLAADD